MVKNLPSKGGDSGSTPGQGTEVPHAAGAAEPVYTRAMRCNEDSAQPKIKK